MAEVFVDTSFLVAALSRGDSNHLAATELGPVMASRSPLTTSHILGECWTLVRRCEEGLGITEPSA